MDQPEPQPRQINITIRGLSRRQLLIGLAGLALSIALAITAIALIRPHLNPHGSPFSNAILAQISGFKPYYPKSGSTDFALQQNSVHYQSGVLVFTMQNPSGKTLAFTEEATPPNFDPTSIQATKNFSTEYGQAYLTDSPDRTTGALFTSDHTWVIINSPSPIGSDAMQQLLGALSHIQH